MIIASSKKNGKVSLYTRLGVIILLAGLLFGCAATKQKFIGGESENLAPFADYTISTMLTTDYGFTEDKTFFIRPYIDYDSQMFQQHDQLNLGMNDFIDSLIEYSVDLVTLSESIKTDAEKVEAYADFVETLRQKILTKTEITSSQLDEILSEIRRQPELLGALRSAQPLINAAARYALIQFSVLQKRLYQLAIAIEKKIAEDHRPFTNYARTHSYKRDAVLDAFAALNDYETGSDTALNDLKRSTAIRKDNLVAGDHLSEDQILELETHLFTELRKLNDIEEQLEDDKSAHLAIYRELQAIYNEEVQKIYNAGVAVLIWSRAHHKMATGVADPAEWFDIKDAPELLLNVGKKML